MLAAMVLHAAPAQLVFAITPTLWKRKSAIACSTPSAPAVSPRRSAERAAAPVLRRLVIVSGPERAQQA